MSLFSEANALVDLISRAINLVQSVRSGWYKNSQDVVSFADRVEELRRKQAAWNHLLKRYGPQAQTLVRPALQAAIEILEREDVVMRNNQATCWLRWSHKTLNFGEANNAIQIVLQAFADIPQVIRDYNEADRLMNEVTAYDLAVLPFRSDKKYVPLVKPLEAVERALESIEGPPVVTLYGQPGTGKTLLAKYLALHYDELRREQQQQQQKGMAVSSPGSNSCFSDGVFFLACGPEATSMALHVELWQNLGFRAKFDQEIQQQEQPNSMPSTDQPSYSESMLHKQLMARLMESSALIILDDVWQTQVLEAILLPGRHLKYLVTSQYKRVWEDAVQINISKPTLEESRKILVNHVVGLPVDEHEDLPLDIQEVADAMIRASEFNPLVLANLALTISGERATNPDEWITARKYLLELLDDDDKGPVAYGQTYPHTVASSMTMAVNSMAVEAKNLLFLAAVCEGPHVPEMVLKMFFKSLHGSLARFKKWSNYLEDRVFIQIETHVVEWTNVPQRTWSVHGLRQHFILEKQNDKVSSMVVSLLRTQHKDSDIVRALYLLFAEKSSIHEGAAGKFQPLDLSKETDESFNQSSIKPFLWLLHADSDEEWKRNAHEMAKKIIVDFVRLGRLDDTALSNLLAMAETQVATCCALETMARLEQKALLTENHEATLQSLLALLDVDAVHPKIQSWGAVALGALALKNHEIIVAQPSSVKHLFELLLPFEDGNLAAHDNHNVQLYAAWTLGNLAATSKSKSIIVSYPGMLNALLTLLRRDEDPDVQIEAAYSLRRLGYGEQIAAADVQSRQAKIIAFPGMLEQLVHLLHRGTIPEVRGEVVWLLGNLATSLEEKVKIGDHPGVLTGLVGILDIREKSFDTQRYHATYALRRLTLKTGDSKLKSIAGAIQRLVDLLFDDGRPDVQQEAAHCLSFLAYPENSRVEFAAYPRAVEGFVRLILRHDVNPTTQLIATGTLANLVEADKNKLLIASEPGAIQGLVRLLAKYQGSHNTKTQFTELVELAVRCLEQLSFENPQNQLTIAAFPGALEGLVELLGDGGGGSNIWVQQLAAWAISNLAQAVANRKRIEAFPRAVEKLTELLETEGLDPGVRTYAEDALSLVLGRNLSVYGEGPFGSPNRPRDRPSGSPNNPRERPYRSSNRDFQWTLPNASRAVWGHGQQSENSNCEGVC